MEEGSLIFMIQRVVLNQKFVEFEAFATLYPLAFNKASDHVMGLCSDDPKWIKRCVDNDQNACIPLLHTAVRHDKLNIVKYMAMNGVQLGLSIDHFRSRQMARLLIDCGSALSTRLENLWVNESIQARLSYRHCAILTIGAKRCHSPIHRDVLQIIARCVWSARLCESFWF